MTFEKYANQANRVGTCVMSAYAGSESVRDDETYIHSAVSFDRSLSGHSRIAKRKKQRKY